MVKKPQTFKDNLKLKIFFKLYTKCKYYFGLSFIFNEIIPPFLTYDFLFITKPIVN